MNKPVDTHLALADARRLTQRVHFERDGTVTIASGKVDLGQGISTALAQIAAEELGVALEKVRILPASTAYSPDEGVTSGSLSIQDGGKGLRKACAELRELLKRSGKRSYWELEVAGDIPAEAPQKPPAEYRIPFICHASIGPSCALARMEGEPLEVWSHTQGIFGLRQELAMVLRLPEERIVVHHAEGAGCYGHNGADDVALDAALIARM